MKTPHSIALMQFSACVLLAGAVRATAAEPVALDPSAPPTLIIEAAWKPSWSPDQKEVVYVRHKAGGIEVMNLASGKKRLLTRNGKDPAWSPDGKWIAFVREAGPDDYISERLCVIPAEGGFVADLGSGGFPGWSENSRRLYFHSRTENQVLFLRVDKPDDPPTTLSESTPSWYFAVAPNGKSIAFGVNGALEIRDSQTREIIAKRGVPERGLLPAWSPDGTLVAFGGFNDSREGLRVFDVKQEKLVCVKEGAFTMPAWSPNGSWLAFDERSSPAWNVWAVSRGFVDKLLLEAKTEKPEDEK